MEERGNISSGILPFLLMNFLQNGRKCYTIAWQEEPSHFECQVLTMGSYFSWVLVVLELEEQSIIFLKVIFLYTWKLCLLNGTRPYFEVVPFETFVSRENLKLNSRAMKAGDAFVVIYYYSGSNVFSQTTRFQIGVGRYNKCKFCIYTVQIHIILYATNYSCNNYISTFCTEKNMSW